MSIVVPDGPARLTGRLVAALAFRGLCCLALLAEQVSAEPSSMAREGTVFAKEANVQRVWLFLGTTEGSSREGFLRVVNHSTEGGEVRIEAVDDEGTPAGPVALSVGASQAIHLNSRDLEGGNADKGLPTGIGPGQGDWRLTLSSALDIEALSYVRTKDGLVATMHDIAPTLEDGSHQVAFLNPGSNHRQESRLRLVNPGAAAATVRITGTDDSGQPGAVAVTAEVPAGQSRAFTAAELESGNAPGLSGALGDGAGKWRLRMESARDIVAMSLLATPTGHLANLSAPPPEPDADGAHVVPLFLSASDPLERQGFLRVVNRSDAAGTVRIEAFDQSDFAYDPVTLSLEPGQARHFNSLDLEVGNADKGLSGSTGAGRGDWRLELTSDLDIQVLAYVRTKDGCVTSMNGLAPAAANDLAHRIAFFNPASNDRQVSWLRLVNEGASGLLATVSGVDDGGHSPGIPVRLRVPGGTALEIPSPALESGEGEGIWSGALGDGERKWRLRVEADGPLRVMNLLRTPTGHLVNMSTTLRRDGSRTNRQTEPEPQPRPQRKPDPETDPEADPETEPEPEPAITGFGISSGRTSGRAVLFFLNTVPADAELSGVQSSWSPGSAGRIFSASLRDKYVQFHCTDDFSGDAVVTLWVTSNGVTLSDSITFRCT